MFGLRSSHCLYCDNFLSGHTTTALEGLVICSSIVLIATSVQLVVGRIRSLFCNCNLALIRLYLCIELFHAKSK